ncbi:MAG: tetratricopeptide repeat protein [Elusimicrobia bacterium]|nr:tetratricopeptide repeat protein [Elusimicrobiota bacterium]
MKRGAAVLLALACACAHQKPAPQASKPEEGPKSALEELRNSGPALSYQAQSKLESEEYAEVLELLRKAVKGTPELAKLDPGRRLERLEALYGELDLDSDDHRALFARSAGPAGRCAADSIKAYVEGRDVEAVLFASAAAGEDPQKQPIRRLLAAVSKGTGLEAPKEQQLPRAALVQYKLQRAEKAYFDKRFGEAARECQEAVWLDPDSALAWTRLGSARWASGEPEKAREAFDRVLVLDPHNAEVRQFMEAKGLLGRGRPAAGAEIKSQ